MQQLHQLRNGTITLFFTNQILQTSTFRTKENFKFFAEYLIIAYRMPHTVNT